MVRVSVSSMSGKLTDLVYSFPTDPSLISGNKGDGLYWRKIAHKKACTSDTTPYSLFGRFLKLPCEA